MWGGQDVSELSHTPLSQAQRKGGTKALRESQEQRREEGDRDTGESRPECSQVGEQRKSESAGYPERQTVVTTVGRVWETRHRIGRPTQRIESWDRGKTVAGRLVERDWEIDSHTEAKIPRGWRGDGGVRRTREISRIVQTDKQRRGCPEAGVRQRSAKKSSDSDRQRETEADPFQRALDLSSVGAQRDAGNPDKGYWLGQGPADARGL